MTQVQKYLDELVQLRAELARLRALLEGRCTVWATFRDGAELPDDVGLSDSDGDPIDVDVDASGLIAEIRRRQVAAQSRRGDEPELGALLGLVPPGRALRVDDGDRRPYEASWEEWDEILTATGPTREAAIRAVTLQLLELPPGSSCRTCEHWERDAEPGGDDAQ